MSENQTTRQLGGMYTRKRWRRQRPFLHSWWCKHVRPFDMMPVLWEEEEIVVTFEIVRGDERSLGLFSLFFSCSNDFFPTHPYRIVSSLAFSISLLRIVSYSLRVGCGSRTTEKIKTNRTFFFVADSFCCYKAKEMLFCDNLSFPIYNWHDFLHGFPFHL